MINYDKPTYQVLDKDIEKDIKYLTSYNDGNLHIISRTLDDFKWVVAYESDKAPLKYYKYNQHTTKDELLFTNLSNLEQYNLLKMQPVVIKSHDRLDLVSYITFPTGIILDKFNKPNYKTPLIIYVYDGPNARDVWGLNITHQ